MPKFLFTGFVIALLGMLFSASSVYAESLLTSIGNVQTEGYAYSRWNYTAQNPVLTGTAPADSLVTVTIDSVSYTTSANGSGTWVFYPTTLTEGEHGVSITTTADSYTFTLVIGSDTAIPSTASRTTSTTGSQTATSSARTLLQAGTADVSALLFSAGLILIGAGFITKRQLVYLK